MVKKKSFLGEIFKPMFGWTKIRLWEFSGDWWGSPDKKDDRVAKDKEGNLYSWDGYKQYWRKQERKK